MSYEHYTCQNVGCRSSGDYVACTVEASCAFVLCEKCKEKDRENPSLPGIVYLEIHNFTGLGSTQAYQLVDARVF
jgi:hypothetical protein